MSIRAIRRRTVARMAFRRWQAINHPIFGRTRFAPLGSDPRAIAVAFAAAAAGVR